MLEKQWFGGVSDGQMSSVERWSAGVGGERDDKDGVETVGELASRRI